ncbi:DUF6284 family protein [Streptomyces sp. NRRL S-241]|uniref:DUF6284 family protein n=1 Tax=Streptomyces sp. NRRL S-241 TaxID=1463896 RepID=UPI000D11ABD1
MRRSAAARASRVRVRPGDARPAEAPGVDLLDAEITVLDRAPAELDERRIRRSRRKALAESGLRSCLRPAPVQGAGRAPMAKDLMGWTSPALIGEPPFRTRDSGGGALTLGCGGWAQVVRPAGCSTWAPDDCPAATTCGTTADGTTAGPSAAEAVRRTLATASAGDGSSTGSPLQHSRYHP